MFKAVENCFLKLGCMLKCLGSFRNISLARSHLIPIKLKSLGVRHRHQYLKNSPGDSVCSQVGEPIYLGLLGLP